MHLFINEYNLYISLKLKGTIMLILRVLIIFFIFTNLSYANDLLSYEKDSMVAIKALASNLKKSLKSVIKNSGPVAAVEYCNIAAFDITDKVSKEKNVLIKRTSLKLRNKNNIPAAWEIVVLNNFEKRKISGEGIQSLNYKELYVDDSNKTFFRYMKAIPTGKVCLTCHGSNIKPKLLSKINELYPEDKARDFKLGDIRGAFSIQIPIRN